MSNNNLTGNSSYDCPFGITNQKEIEKSNERNSIMIENFDKAVKHLGESMNEKFDELNKKITDIDKKIDTGNDILETKFDKMNNSLDDRIDVIVTNKFKFSIFNLIKWLAGSIVVAVVVKASLLYFIPIAG